MRTLLFSLYLICAPISIALSAPHTDPDDISHLDQQTRYTLELLAAGDLQQAQLMARMLAWRFPDYALGQFLSAELESVNALNDVMLSDELALENKPIELILEAQARLADPVAEGALAVPQEFVQTGRDVSQVLVVDLSRSRLYQFDTRGPTPQLIHYHYAASGKAGYGKQIEGDNKTPLGVYRVVEYFNDASLPELYGSGALTLDYPNALDKSLGRTGYGIWLHGVPRPQMSRSPRSSEGCVTMSNEHLSRLAAQINPDTTRVILTDQIRWLHPSARKRSQDFFQNLFRDYQRREALRQQRPEERAMLTALEQLDARDVSIFYHPGFTSEQSQLNGAAQYLVMSARFGSQQQYELSLYWARSVEAGWQLIDESLLEAGT